MFSPALRAAPALGLFFLSSLAVTPAWCQNPAPADAGTGTLSLPAVPLPSRNDTGFILSLVRDGRGDVWAGTEDNGVWRFDRAASKWINYRVQNGLGDDNAYALTVDGLGRVWVGHLNHGVSVWNGHSWRNYPVLRGPLGERVFAIATSPLDGAVWMATNAGLTRYSPTTDAWTHFNRGTGLPTEELSALAFDSEGDLLVGTQCDGLLIGIPGDGFKNWRGIKGADTLPDTAFGSGLPSNQINDVAVGEGDTLFVATTRGLARSKDGGASWTFIRGADWKDKLSGLYEKRQPQPVQGDLPAPPLREDYVTRVACDPGGLLWIAYRLHGTEVRRPLDQSAVFAPQPPTSAPQNLEESFPFASALFPLGNGQALVGTYSAGLTLSAPDIAPAPPQEVADVDERRPQLAASAPGLNAAVPFPSPAKTPTAGELNALLASLGDIAPQDPNTPFVAPLEEDWTTQGDWLGRYGRYWASLNAMISPANYLWGAGWTPIQHAFQISPKQHGDSLRYWVEALATDNPRDLEMPPVYYDSRVQKGYSLETQTRRQSQINDDGHVYPLTQEGPNIYFSLAVPPGLWTLSLYNHNKSGQQGLNQLRDYALSVRSHDEKKPIDDVTDFDAQPELARARQRDFWDGVYTRFLVRGPQQLTIEMSRNYSHNTLLAGAFLDLVDERPAPYFGSVEDWQRRQSDLALQRDTLEVQSATQRAARFAPGKEGETAQRLFLEVERLRQSNPLAWSQKSRPVYETLARWLEPALQSDAPDKAVLRAEEGTCLYYLGRYSQWEETQKLAGLTPARDIEHAQIWDDKSNYAGTGFETITAYLKARTLPKSKTAN